MSTFLNSTAQNVNSELENSPKRIIRERYDYVYDIILQSNKESIFPLLCPTKEYDWFNGWECVLNYSKSGFAENDCVFYTKLGFPLFRKQIFYVTNYEPSKNITFLIFINKIAIIKFGASLDDLNEDTCKLTLFYKATGLSNFGNKFLKTKGRTEMENNSKNIEKDLNYWIKYNTIRPKDQL